MADSSQVSRRRFLQTGALVTGAAAAAPITALAFAAKPRTKVLKAVHPELAGRWIEPGQSGYAMAAWPNNARYADIHPGAVAMCADESDVQKCVVWARENNKTFLIRSGGHNYAGFSTLPNKTAPDLLIDVKAMNRVVNIDTDKGLVTVMGGANNQDVANALHSLPYAVPSGRCPTVGTSGLVLGGGWGFAATHSGLTCDSLVSTEIVLADGSKVTISKEQNPDLFWAVRGGGGGNFGVHTSFTFALHDVKDEVTTFNVVFEAGKQVELLTKLQEIQNANAKMISTRSKARPKAAGANPSRKDIVVETLGLYWGKKEALEQILAPLFQIQPQTLVKDIYQVDYWRARDYLLTDDPNGMYQIKSSYVGTVLSEDALNNMLTWMTKWPGGSLRQDNMGILFAIGGAVREVDARATAYVHRNSNYIYEMEANWAPIDSDEVVKRQRAWLAEYFDDMQRYVQPESYVNFPDRDLVNWARRYYGCNLERLTQVKAKVDPHNIFNFAQSIPLKLPANWVCP